MRLFITISLFLQSGSQTDNVGALIDEYFLFTGIGEERQALAKKIINAGNLAFPYYDGIFEDSMISELKIAELFALLKRTAADCTKYKPIAHKYLVHKGPSRREILAFLSKHGNNEDLTPMIALLYDRDNSISLSSAKAITALGGQNEALALTIWLKSDSHKDDDQLRKEVTACVLVLEKKPGAKHKAK